MRLALLLPESNNVVLTFNLKFHSQSQTFRKLYNVALRFQTLHCQNQTLRQLFIVLVSVAKLLTWFKSSFFFVLKYEPFFWNLWLILPDPVVSE